MQFASPQVQYKPVVSECPAIALNWLELGLPNIGGSKIRNNNVAASTNRLIRIIGIAPLLGNFGVDELASRCRLLAAFKDYAALKQLSGLIDNPLSLYYEAIANASSTLADPGSLLDLRVSDTYRPRVILTGGQFLLRSGSASDVPVARRLIAEAKGYALREADWLTVYQATKEAAIIDSLNGDHRKALQDLQSLSPMVKLLQKNFAPLYFDYFNSVSVELLETGEIDQARRLASIALFSPYVKAYPECIDTLREIELRARPRVGMSVLIARPVPDNVIKIGPGESRRGVADTPQGPGRILDFPGPRMTNQTPSTDDAAMAELRKQLRNKIIDALYERGERIPPRVLERILKKIEETPPLKRETS